MQIERLSKIIVYFTLCAILFGGKDLFSTFSYEQSVAGVSQIGIGIRDWLHDRTITNDVIRSIFICTNAFFVTRISLRFFHFLPKNYVPAILYLCLMCSSGITQNDTITEILLFLLLAYIERLLFLLYDKNSKRNSFEAGLILGLTVLIAPVFLFFYFIILIAQIYSGTFHFREVSLPIIGGFVPLFLYAYFRWVFGESFFAPFNEIAQLIEASFLRRSINIYQFRISELVYIGFIAGQLIFGIVRFILHTRNNIRKQINTYQLFIWMLALSLLLIALFYDNATMIVQTLFIPATIIISILFLQLKNQWIKTTLFAINILSPIILSFLQH